MWRVTAARAPRPAVGHDALAAADRLGIEEPGDQDPGRQVRALELLQRIDPCPALDLGCGSGVLAIAAARLGFGPLACFDRDPLAVGATAENAERNGVAVEVSQADVLVDPLPPVPLWIANLELGLLHTLLERPDLPPRILVSGLLDPETVGGGERVVADGWAAELVEP